MAFQQYRRTQIAEMEPWGEGYDMTHVSVSAPDKEAGSPKPGDMIARNPKNHGDKWLVTARYFAENFEPLGGHQRDGANAGSNGGRLCRGAEAVGASDGRRAQLGKAHERRPGLTSRDRP
jgi:hypothetical protein